MIREDPSGSGGQADHHSRRRKRLTYLVPDGWKEGEGESHPSRFVVKIEKHSRDLRTRIVEGKLKDRDKMFMSLGRIQASHPQGRIL